MRHEYVLTNKCNLKCVYCSFPNRGGEKSLKKVKNEILLIYKNNFNQLAITGGEPSLNKDLDKIIFYAKKIGFKEVILETNGYGLDDINYAKSLISSGLDSIGFSFQGVNSKTHDSVVGVKGHHEKLMKAISNLIKLNFSNIIFTPVITEFNYRDIPEIIRFAEKHRYFLRFNFVRIHQYDFFERSNLSYKEVVPEYSKVCKVFYDSFKKNPPREAYEAYNNIPPCAFYAIGEDIFKYIEPNEGHLSPEIHSAELKLYSKPKMCEKCKFNKTCQGIFYTYVAERGLAEFKPILK